MTLRLAWLALAASVLALAGCTSAPELPPPPSKAEVEQRVAESAAQWWSTMFPDEPQPVVEPIAYLTQETQGSQVTDCVENARLEGVTVSGTGGFSISGAEKPLQDALQRQLFICAQQYPYDPAESNYLTQEQLAWVWAYNQQRLVPCLQLLGFDVPNRAGGYVDGGRESWIPYYDIEPLPGPEEWRGIDLRCPPSPVGPLQHPTNG